MNTSRRFLTVLSGCLLFAALAAGCSTTLFGGATAVPTEVRMTDDQNGQRVEVRVGQALQVALKANPTTGYTWEVSKPLSFLEAVGEPEFVPESNLMGAPGRLALSFKVTGKGEGTLELIYHRPWEKDVAPLNTYTLHVVTQ